MKYLIYLLIILLPSCTLTKLQRQSNKVARKIERLERKYPEAFKITNTETLRIDTIIQRVEVKGLEKVDTVKIDKIITEFSTDTIERVKIRERLIEAVIPTVRKDTLGIKLFITGTPQGLSYTVIRDPLHIEAEKSVDRITVTKTEVIRRPFWKDWKFWLFLILYLIFRFFGKAILVYIKGITPFK